MRFAETDKIGHSGHGAVVIDDLADHACGAQAREAGEIDGRLGLSSTFKDAARAGAEREDMSRPGKVVWRTPGMHCGPDLRARSWAEMSVVTPWPSRSIECSKLARSE